MVSTHLKNISQIGWSPQVGVKMKNVWNHHPSIISEFLQKKKAPIHIPRVVFSRKPFWAKPHCSWDYWPPQRWAKQRSPNTTCRFRQWSVVPFFGGFTAFWPIFFGPDRVVFFWGYLFVARKNMLKDDGEQRINVQKLLKWEQSLSFPDGMKKLGQLKLAENNTLQ